MAMEDQILGTTLETEEKRRQKEEAERQKQEIAAAGGGPLVTPMGAASTGATEDQAKMFGTAAQKSGALEQAAQQAQAGQADQDQQLATFQGEQTFEDRVTNPKAEAAKEFTQSMEQFGSLGGRVEQLVTEAFKKKELEGPTIEVDSDMLEEVLAEGVNEEGRKKAKSILEAFAADPSPENQKAFEDNTNLFSGTDIFESLGLVYGLDEAGINSMVAESMAEGIIDPGEVTLDTILKTYPDAIGLDPGDLEEFLGPDWREMTPNEVDDKLEKAQRAAGGRIAKLQKDLQDPNLTAAARETIMQELREAGASGEIQAEAEAGEAISKAGEAETLRFGGETLTVDEILDDDRITGQIQTYLELEEDSEERKTWVEENPDLAEWVDQQAEQVKEQTGSLEDAIEVMKEIQKANKELGDTTIGGIQIKNVDGLGEIFGLTDGIQTSKSKKDFVQALQNIEKTGIDMNVAMTNLEEIFNSPDNTVSDHMKKLFLDLQFDDTHAAAQDDLTFIMKILSNPNDWSSPIKSLEDIYKKRLRTDSGSITATRKPIGGSKTGIAGKHKDQITPKQRAKLAADVEAELKTVQTSIDKHREGLKRNIAQRSTVGYTKALRDADAKLRASLRALLAREKKLKIRARKHKAAKPMHNVSSKDIKDVESSLKSGPINEEGLI